MKSPYRALLWEQARTAGVICLTLGVMSGLFILMTHILFQLDQLGTVDVQGVAAILLGFSLMGSGLVTSRQDVRGHIVWDFDSRWFRLPVSIPVLLAIVFSSRILFLTLLLLFQFLITLTLPRVKAEELTFFVIFPLYLYAFLQAAAWTWRRAPILFYMPVVVLFGTMLSLRFLGLTPEEIFRITSRTLREPPIRTLVLPLAGLLMGCGIYLERQDRYFGPRNLSWLTRPFLWLLSPPLKKPKTAFEAQLWYEMRRVSWVLPLFTMAFTMFFLLLLLLIETYPLSSGFGQYVPLAALVASGLAAGGKGLFPRSSMQHLRPMEDSGMAAARILAQLRGLFLAILISGLLSLLLLLAGPLERSILRQLWVEGFNPVFDIFIIITRPLVLAALVTWIALWIQTPPMIIAAIILYGFLRVSFHFLSDSYTFLLYPFVLYGFIAIIILATFSLLAYTQLRGMISRNQLILVLCLHVILSSFIWLGSRSLEGGTGLLLAIAISALLAAPIPSLSWFIRAQRHDVGTWRFYI